MDVADVNKYKIISNIFWFFSIFKLCDTFLQIISIEIWNVKLARGNQLVKYETNWRFHVLKKKNKQFFPWT